MEEVAPEVKSKKKKTKTKNTKKTVVWEALFERNLCHRRRCVGKIVQRYIEPRAGGVLDCPQLLASVRTTVIKRVQSVAFGSIFEFKKRKTIKERKQHTTVHFYYKELLDGTVK